MLLLLSSYWPVYWLRFLLVMFVMHAPSLFFLQLRGLMVVGIDSYHDSAKKGRSVGAFIASMNQSLTRYHSRCAFQHNMQELMDALKLCLQGTVCWSYLLTLPMLRLHSSKAQEHKNLWKPSKPCHVGIHWKALAEYSQITTHLPGFWWFFRFFASFCIGRISQQQHKG